MKNEGRYLQEFGGFIKDEKLKLNRFPKFINSDDWEDISWHNNECPSFRNEKLGLDVWVNFKDLDNGVKAYAVDRVEPDGSYIGTPICSNFLCDIGGFIRDEERKYNKKKNALARMFSRILSRTLLNSDMVKVVKMNSEEKDRNICHSHDYIDANMVMAEAFKKIVGKNPVPSSERDCILWSEAWDLAKSKSFYWR